MSTQWALGIDYGTMYTVAAVHEDGRTRVLEIDGRQRISSGVYFAEDETVVVGEEAGRRGAAQPDRFERTPKRYLDLGQPPIALGNSIVAVTRLVAATLRHVYEEAVRQYEVPPSDVVLTHPAGWGERRQQLLADAAEEAGLPTVRLVAEPVAAAAYLASERVGGKPVGHGEYVAVYDLGGGTFDAALLRRNGAAFDLVGQAGGDAHIGGELFDDLLYRRLGADGLLPDVWRELQTSTAADWQRANAAFRTEVRDAKEAVSREASSPIYLPPPVDETLLMTREQVENLVRPEIEKTVDLLADTVSQAGRSAGLSAVYLAGGSSRMPIVAHVVRERFGRADTKGDPKHVVALGAARFAHPELDADVDVIVDNALVDETVQRHRRLILVGAGIAAALAGVLAVLGAHAAMSSPSTPVADQTSLAITTSTLPPPPLSSSSSRVVPPPMHSSTPRPSPSTSSASSLYTTVTGMVKTASGAPYPGASVEFADPRTANNDVQYNVHTTTGANGRYSMQVPNGLWRVEALDSNNLAATFSVVGMSSNDVVLPGLTTVNFVED